VGLDQLYRLHTPFVIAFLAFVLIFVVASVLPEQKK
jgi:hypothetical protein